MRTIIAGSRLIINPNVVEEAIKRCGWKPSVVLSGHAMGVDRLGEQWAEDNGVVVELYPAEWGKYGKSAGYKRNVLMADNADALVAVWDGKSRGTGHMIRIARDRGLSVFVWEAS
jgi:YspA, cpYpsA-related SLOG family